MIYWIVLLMDPVSTECVDPSIPQVCYPNHHKDEANMLNLLYATWEEADTVARELRQNFKHHTYEVASVLTQKP